MVIDKSIIWSCATLVVSFCLCFMILALVKPEFVVTVNDKGDKRVNYSKTSLISTIVSISLAVVVLVFMLSNEDKAFGNLKIPEISIPKIFKSDQSTFSPSDTWNSPI